MVKIFKLDKSRARDEEASEAESGGMGLPIAGRILEAHKYRYGSKSVETVWNGEKVSGVEFWFSA